MLRLKGKLKQFLGLFYYLLKKNIKFAYPYPLKDNYSIYYLLTIYQTNKHYTKYTLLS